MMTSEEEKNKPPIEVKTETHAEKETSAEKQREEKSKQRICWDWFSTFFVKNYLPISLIFAVIFGALVPAPGVFLNHKETISVCIAIKFVYIGLYLRTSAVKVGIKAYKAYLWSIISILLVTCVIGGQLTNLLNFDEWKGSVLPTNTTSSGNVTNNTESTLVGDGDGDALGPFECKVGLVLYLIMPCTVGSGVILVMNLKGHAALGILITVFCNIVGIFTVPLYLEWLIYSNANVSFDIGNMMLKLFITLFIPLFIGKCLRFITPVRNFISVPSRKNKIKMIAFTALAFVLLIKTSQSSHDGGLRKITGKTGAVICFWALTMHLLFMLINTTAVFILKIPTDQKKTVIILASQKTLAQAVATSVFIESLGDVGLIAVTMVFCHLTILIFDSILIAVWLYIEERKTKDEETQTLLKTNKEEKSAV